MNYMQHRLLHFVLFCSRFHIEHFLDGEVKPLKIELKFTKLTTS